jgi:small subunit ribosomal protein S6
MAKPPTLYDLMVLIHSDTEADRHEEILAQIRTMVTEGGGTLEAEHDWGVRPMTFEIADQADASYHLFQLTGPSSLLDTLRHTLRIADGVARHRIIKVRPGTPPPPEVRLAPAGAEY